MGGQLKSLQESQGLLTRRAPFTKLIRDIITEVAGPPISIHKEDIDAALHEAIINKDFNVFLPEILYRNASEDVANYYEGIKNKLQETISFEAKPYISSQLYSNFKAGHNPGAQ